MFLEAIIPEHIIHSYIFKMILASIFGAVIGLERDVHGRAAGLRTMLLVCLGSAAFMILSESIAQTYAKLVHGSELQADPSRIAAQIITGIGFLGAGSIIKYGFTIRGLTTAACLWISAAIGMGVGAGFIDIAFVATLLSLITLTLLNKLDKSFARDVYKILKITTTKNADISLLMDVLEKSKLKVLSVDKEINYDEGTLLLNFYVRLHFKGVAEEFSEQLIHELEDTGITFHSLKWLHG